MPLHTTRDEQLGKHIEKNHMAFMQCWYDEQEKTA